MTELLIFDEKLASHGFRERWYFPGPKSRNATLLDPIGAPIAVRLNCLGTPIATTMGYPHGVTDDEWLTADELGKSLHVTERNEGKKNLEVRPLTLELKLVRGRI